MLENLQDRSFQENRNRLKQKMYCFCWMQILRCCAGRRTGSDSIFAKTMEISARSSMGKAESAARTAGFVHSHPITGPMRKIMRFFRPKRS